MKAKCSWCGNPFTQSRSALVYCSPKCEGVANRVKETREPLDLIIGNTEFKPLKSNRFQFTTQRDWDKRAYAVIDKLSNSPYAQKALPKYDLNN